MKMALTTWWLRLGGSSNLPYWAILGDRDLLFCASATASAEKLWMHNYGAFLERF